MQADQATRVRGRPGRRSPRAHQRLQLATGDPRLGTSLPYSAWADTHLGLLAVSGVVWLVGLAVTITARHAHAARPLLSGG